MAMTLRKRAPRPQEPADPSPVKKRKLKSRGRKPRARSAGYRLRGRRGRWGSSDDEVVSSSSSSSSSEEEEVEEEEVPEYEKIREQRMRENKEKMEKLGIFSLSQHFNTKKPARRAPAKRKPSITRSFAATYERARRSARIKESGSYFKNEGTLESMGISIPEAWAPEVYTEEHEKLLGNCEKPWALYVDGYGEDGERLYDPLYGKMCHQCRQKTVGHLSLCRKCKSAQGQLCGDCLYMRYGENVLEANENLNWSCPSCRGICNCSRCRRAKGWAPTVCLYQQVIELGYKSVAHYLILSRHANSKPDDVAVAAADAKVNPEMSPQSAPQTVVDLDTSDDDFSAVEADAYDSDSSQEAYESRKREPSLDAATDDENETSEALDETHFGAYKPQEPEPEPEPSVKALEEEDNENEKGDEALENGLEDQSVA